jgi:hypothetical protein
MTLLPSTPLTHSASLNLGPQGPHLPSSSTRQVVSLYETSSDRISEVFLERSVTHSLLFHQPPIWCHRLESSVSGVWRPIPGEKGLVHSTYWSLLREWQLECLYVDLSNEILLNRRLLGCVSHNGFWETEKQNQFNTTVVFISNLCWNLYFRDAVSLMCFYYQSKILMNNPVPTENL